MDNPRRPVSFIASDCPSEARVFYRDVLGLNLQDSSPFALVFEENGHVLRIQIVSDFQPTAYTVHGWQVENIVDDVQTLKAKGVAFMRFENLDQDALGLWTTPDGHKVAWFQDPSRNVLSFTELASL